MEGRGGLEGLSLRRVVQHALADVSELTDGLDEGGPVRVSHGRVDERAVVGKGLAQLEVQLIPGVQFRLNA